MSVGESIKAEVPMQPKIDTAGGMELYVQSMSGSSATICTQTAATPQSLCNAIEQALGISAKAQRWLLEDKQIAYHEAATLANTPLTSGDRLTVVHVGFTPLVPLADAFELELNSVRQKFRTGYSSAFNIMYSIKGVISEGWMVLEPWRKNDHDEILFDTKAGIIEKADSHWMAGTTCTTTPLKGDPLGEIVQSWNAASEEEEVTDETERFWLSSPLPQELAAEKGPRKYATDENQTLPDYSAVPGWFIVPSDDCIEVKADIPLPISSKRIVRLLINQNGEPLRAAVKGSRLGGLHQDIEEYVLKVSALARGSIIKPSPQRGQVS